MWNRIEGRPRTTDFDRALRTEVRDPLWMLTRQWQLGEFHGSDAGSPVTATYSVAPSRPTRFRPDGGGPVENLPTDRPLETMAERRLLPLAFGPEKIAFDVRLAIGHRWFKLLNKAGLLGHVLSFEKQYVQRYPIALPDPQHAEDVNQVAHPQVWATMQTIAGRRMDGYLLYLHVKNDGDADAGINTIPLLHHTPLVNLGKRLVAWFDALIDQPTGVTAGRPDGDATWDPRRFEHRFSVSASVPGGGEKVLTAREYPGGELDWHAFSVDPGPKLGGPKPPEQPLNRTVFPAPVRFSGMPLPRWWALEDGKTNFAAVRPDSTDLPG